MPFTCISSNLENFICWSLSFVKRSLKFSQYAERGGGRETLEVEKHGALTGPWDEDGKG